jgi:hypothetical protein
VFKGEAHKIEVRKRNKYGGLSGRNPSDKKFEVWIRSRVKTHSERAENFQVVRSRRSGALVSHEESSKFCRTKRCGRNKVKFTKS